MLGGMILKFRGAQLAVRQPHRDFCTLERLGGGCAALVQGARAVEIDLHLIGLRPRPLDHGLGALAVGFGRAEALLGFLTAARIEKWCREGSIVATTSSAFTGSPALSRTRVSRPASGAATTYRSRIARLAVLVHGGDELALLHGRRLDRYRPGHQRPDDQRQSGDNAQQARARPRVIRMLTPSS